MTTPEPPTIAAEALLMRLKAHGIDYLFANGGTNFAPIIEAYVTGSAKGSAMPQPLIIPHETAAVAMAHGGSVHMTQDTCGKQVLPSQF